jgi:hypothetical protein
MIASCPEFVSSANMVRRLRTKAMIVSISMPMSKGSWEVNSPFVRIVDDKFSDELIKCLIEGAEQCIIDSTFNVKSG